MKSGKGRYCVIVLIDSQTELCQASFDKIYPRLVISREVFNDLGKVRSVCLFIEVDWREPYELSVSVYTHRTTETDSGCGLVSMALPSPTLQ